MGVIYVMEPVIMPAPAVKFQLIALHFIKLGLLIAVFLTVQTEIFKYYLICHVLLALILVYFAKGLLLLANNARMHQELFIIIMIINV